MNLSRKLAATLLLFAPAFAASAHPHPSFDYVTLGGSSIDEEALSDNYKSYGGIASMSLTSRLYTQVSYNKMQDDFEIAGSALGADYTTFGLGIGYRIPLTHATEMTVFLNLSDTNGSVEVESDLFDVTGESYTAGIGYIARLGSFELGADIFYVKGTSDVKTPGVQAKVRYFFSEHFSLDINGLLNDEINSVGLSMSYHF